MSGLENGFIRAISDIFVGLIVSVVLSALSSDLGSLPLLLISLVSLLGMIETFEKMNHWSILYIGGWIIGFWLFGTYLLSAWEIQLSLLIGIFYLALKISRK